MVRLLKARWSRRRKAVVAGVVVLLAGLAVYGYKSHENNSPYVSLPARTSDVLQARFVDYLRPYFVRQYRGTRITKLVCPVWVYGSTRAGRDTTTYYMSFDCAAITTAGKNTCSFLGEDGSNATATFNGSKLESLLIDPTTINAIPEKWVEANWPAKDVRGLAKHYPTPYAESIQDDKLFGCGADEDA